MPAAAVMTADEYLRLPYDGRRTQLVEGEVIVDAPAWDHQHVCTDLLVALVLWTRAEPCRGMAIMPIDVRLDDRNVYNPDILWYGHDRSPGRSDSRPYPMPDIAVEVRSPSTWRFDVGVKKATYEREGLPELWLADPRAKTLLIFRRSGSRAGYDVSIELERDELLTSPQLPGFSLALSELFRDDD